MRWTAWGVLALLALGGACKKKGEDRQANVPAPTPEAGGAAAGPSSPADAGAAPTPPGGADATGSTPSSPAATPVLLITQSRFVAELQPDGTTKQKPGPATLLVLRQAGPDWEPETIEDPDSNVFHKALVFDPDGKGPAVLTIGAMGAYLKAWRRDGEDWTATTLWHPTFGGAFDRLRDLEIGDVTGDGNPEIVIATHDQGVVGVLQQGDGAWKAAELDKRPGIFVHEVEIGDIDGDGKNEFFTTPSQPNTSGEQQGGGIDMYRWDGSTFVRTPVVWSEAAHAKEILVADIDGDGTAALYAVLEAKTEAGSDCTKDPNMVPLRIVLYEPDGSGAFAERAAATLPDCMCRFLTWGDVDGDGSNEMVAATKNAGVWLLRRGERAEGTAERIDGDSGGFEHATLVSDIDGDGIADIVVAADDQGALRRYRWNPQTRSFDRETIFDLGGDQITWNVTAGVLP